MTSTRAQATAASSSNVRTCRRMFVANRGEIAVRVVHACHALGIEAVLGASEADASSLAATLADQTVLIGPAQASESYLNIDRIIAGALASNCHAVHPGYGFLSERPALARACAQAGLVFIGPSAEAMQAMGDKITAVSVAQQAGVPRVPGTKALGDLAQAERAAEDIGYPVLVKAAAGGGGRGMRIVCDESELGTAIRVAANEARMAFGDSTLYLEKFIERARHIEIQVMGDTHGNVVHLGERDCSTQRRHQKLIEESPSPAMTPALRERMAQCALNLARKVNYVGAGTVEFIFDDHDETFYFLEMNTRIQVEHPVTEMITGIDLVAEQIRVACGHPLSFTQADVRAGGHSIECRINAEDPHRNFLPRPGAVTSWNAPSGPGIRIDTHCFAGYTIPPYYDSLLAKLVVHAPSRDLAIEKMREALAAFEIGGITTTLSFLAEVLVHPDFVRGKVTTQWVETAFLPERKARSSLAAA